MKKSKYSKTYYCSCGRKARGGYIKCSSCLNAKIRKRLNKKRTKLIIELYILEKEIFKMGE